MTTKKTTTDQEEEYFARLEAKRKAELREKLDAEAKRRDAEARKAAHWMKCPKCGSDLTTITFKGVEIDRCGGCKGIFLDDGELGLLAGAPESGGFLRGFLDSLRGK